MCMGTQCIIMCAHWRASPRSRELAERKKSLSRQIASSRGQLRKRSLEANGLQQKLTRVEQEELEAMQRRLETAKKHDEALSKVSRRQRQLEAELREKAAQLGEARGTLAYLEYAQEMLERGVALPPAHEAPPPRPRLSGSSAPADSFEQLGGSGASHDEAAYLRFQLRETQLRLEELEEERALLEQDGESEKRSHQDQLAALTGELQRVRTENEALYAQAISSRSPKTAVSEPLPQAAAGGCVRRLSSSGCLLASRRALVAASGMPPGPALPAAASLAARPWPGLVGAPAAGPRCLSQ
ncbi:unnamed protein product, partial [Prorocentrum cordatum]